MRPRTSPRRRRRTNKASRSQARTAEELRRALGVYDPSANSDYIRRFEREVQSLDLSSLSEKSARAQLERSDLLLIGEFHPLPSGPDSAAETLLAWARRGRRPLLGLEFVFARDQQALDAYLTGRIGDREFRRRIRYREEWGYPWPPLRRLLAAARETQAEVRGLDIPPRGGAEDLPRRDAVAAERLDVWLEEAGDRPLLLLYGEAHLASAHLPKRLARLSAKRGVLRLLHDLEREDLVSGDWARDEQRQLVVRQVHPLEARFSALARIYRSWANDPGDGAEIDLPLAVHGLIDAQARALGIESRGHRLGPGVWLADRHPQIYGLPERARIERRLREVALPKSRISSLLDQASQLGALYVSEANLMLVGSAGVSPVALAGGQYLCQALGAAPAASPVPDSDPARLRVDALSVAIARLVDPGRASAAGDEAEDLGTAIAGAVSRGEISRTQLLKQVSSRPSTQAQAQRQLDRIRGLVGSEV